MSETYEYTMHISLNVLNHLGIGLYSSTPAVLSEIVANAWDADATLVTIDIDSDRGEIIIVDNGHGMTVNDINKRYLNIGYARREDGRGLSDIFNRKVMGRKGIGKLSVFSIANTIEVYSKTKGSDIKGLKMVTEDIKEEIKNGTGTYHPEPIKIITQAIDTNLQNNGTVIILKDLHKSSNRTLPFLKKRLARRFSIIGQEYNFMVKINQNDISVQDRNYFDSLEYIWELGKETKYSALATNATDIFSFEDNIINVNGNSYTVKGWVGAVRESNSLQDEEDNLNKISIIVRGKLAQEDILEEFREGGLYTKFLIGEIEADFLDTDASDDIATSSRQKLREDDDRYLALKGLIHSILKTIERKRAELKENKGKDEALKIEPIKLWYGELKGEAKQRAKQLFGKINQIETDPEHRKTLYKHAVLAFENMQFKDAITSFDQITDDNLELFLSLFNSYKDIESTFYYEITTGRLKIIEKLKGQVDENELERVLQTHIFENLWLLDPSWERATEPISFEERIKASFDRITLNEPPEIIAGRMDLKYRKTSGKHVIIELKRAHVQKDISDIIAQLKPYIKAVKDELRSSGRHNESVEALYIVGKLPRGWEDANTMQEEVKSLENLNMRVITYQGLIDQSYNSYGEYMQRHTEKGKLLKLLQQIDNL